MTSHTTERRPPIVANPSDLIPITQLEAELPTPVTGWLVELDRRHIVVMHDDVARDSITRADFRTLILEHRDNEARKVRMQAETEQRAVEQDQQFRASLNPGVPWWLVGRDVHPATAMLQDAQDADYAGRPKSAQTELLEAELGGTKDTMVFHSLGPDSDDAA